MGLEEINRSLSGKKLKAVGSSIDLVLSKCREFCPVDVDVFLYHQRRGEEIRGARIPSSYDVTLDYEINPHALGGDNPIRHTERVASYGYDPLLEFYPLDDSEFIPPFENAEKYCLKGADSQVGLRLKILLEEESVSGLRFFQDQRPEDVDQSFIQRRFSQIPDTSYCIRDL